MKKWQSRYKPGYVGPFPNRLVIYLTIVLPQWLYVAVYPSAMDEQPLDADILDLATHKMCGILCYHNIRWAFTSPFHPYHQTHGMRRFFSVTLLHPREWLPVKKYDALCCPDFPPTAIIPWATRHATAIFFLKFFCKDSAIVWNIKSSLRHIYIYKSVYSPIKHLCHECLSTNYIIWQSLLFGIKFDFAVT